MSRGKNDQISTRVFNSKGEINFVRRRIRIRLKLLFRRLEIRSHDWIYVQSFSMGKNSIINNNNNKRKKIGRDIQERKPSIFLEIFLEELRVEL